MDQRLAAIFSEVPPRPDYNPVRTAIGASKSQEVVSALKLFNSMPPSTGVIANPVRHHHRIAVANNTLELDIRSFTIRGQGFEEDIICERADAIHVIFIGLFGRWPSNEEAKIFAEFLAQCFMLGLSRAFEKTKEFMGTFPDAPPEVAIQHWASFRKVSRKIGAITVSRPANELLTEMIEIHMENVAVAGLASAMRAGGNPPDPKAAVPDAFQSFFAMLLR